MAHEETIRILPDAKTAVLLMHGIAGTPDHFRTLLPLEDMIPEDWSVYNVLIEGHGKRVEDFSRSSMEKWKRHTMGIFDMLCRTHEQVMIIGHSMGTLFALQMALRMPEKVPFVFLIDTPLRVGVKLCGVCNLIRFPFGKLSLQDPIQASVCRACSITPTWKVWKYIGWLPRIVELVREMHRTAKLLPGLTIPVIAFHSRHDEMVSVRTRKILINSGRVDVHDLPNSTHFYYPPEDIQVVRKQLRISFANYVK